MWEYAFRVFTALTFDEIEASDFPIDLQVLYRKLQPMPLLYLVACLFTLAHGQDTLLGSKAAPIPTTINHIDTPIDLREWIRHPPQRSSHRVIQLAKKKPISPPPLPAPPNSMLSCSRVCAHIHTYIHHSTPPFSTTACTINTAWA